MAKLSKLETARRSFVRSYVASHPQRSPAQARATANRLFAGSAGKAALSKALRAQHTRVYEAPKYPKLYRSAKAFGLSAAKAKRASNSLWKLNQAYYRQRDHPEREIVTTFPQERMIERERGRMEYVPGEPVEAEIEMALEQIESEHYSDFYEWWAEYFGEDTWDDRHDIYPEG